MPIRSFNMDDTRPAAVKRAKPTLILIVVLLFVLYFRPCPDFTFYYLWCYPGLGALAVWLAMDIMGLRRHSFWSKYHLSPEVASIGLGGPVAGLPLVVMLLFEMAGMPLLQPDDLLYGEQCMWSFLFAGAEVMGCGQAFWLLWPVAGFKVFWHGTPRLINIGNVLEILTLIFCVAFHIPFFNVAAGIFIYPITLFFLNALGILLGC